MAHNSVPLAELPNLLCAVHDMLASLGKSAPVEAPAGPLELAVPIRKPVTDEHIISLEDGRKFESLKRDLAGLGMTPADCRARWSLPSDYPMVAPAYAAQRSALAKTIGPGRKAVEAAPEPALRPEPEAAVPAPKRGRPKVAA